MHKDLSEVGRADIATAMQTLVDLLHGDGESLALARENLETEFDKAAEVVDG